MASTHVLAHCALALRVADLVVNIVFASTTVDAHEVKTLTDEGRVFLAVSAVSF